MITLIVTAKHRYTVAALCSGENPAAPLCKTMSYDELFCAREIDPGAYIFCDLERLSHIELLAAAEVFAVASRSPRVRCFNDPAKVKMRFGLLRTLREAGLNEFDVYPAGGIPRPKKFPVFIREIATHGKPLTPLLQDQQALDRALAEVESSGYPLSGLLVIEFCAEPFREGVWRRWGAFRLGTATCLNDIVSEDNWNVKYGAVGLVDDDVYAADDKAVRENAFAQTLDQVFALAGVDYGRADFGLVDGRPQIYEINTNPHIGQLTPHSSAIRQSTLEFSRARFLRDLAAMDAPSEGEPVSIELSDRKESRQVIEDLRAHLRDPQVKIAALQAEIEALRAEAVREPAPVERVRRKWGWLFRRER